MRERRNNSPLKDYKVGTWVRVEYSDHKPVIARIIDVASQDRFGPEVVKVAAHKHNISDAFLETHWQPYQNDLMIMDINIYWLSAPLTNKISLDELVDDLSTELN